MTLVPCSSSIQILEILDAPVIPEDVVLLESSLPDSEVEVAFEVVVLLESSLPVSRLRYSDGPWLCLLEFDPWSLLPLTDWLLSSDPLMYVLSVPLLDRELLSDGVGACPLLMLTLSSDSGSLG